MPTRTARREERAHRPHLRGRTPPAGQVQLVLPFRPRSRTDLLSPERSEAMEEAVREAKRCREGSPRQRDAESLLLELLHPFLQSAVLDFWRGHPHTFNSPEDLLQEALLHAQKLWRRFEVGYAGPGRTLYPAYVLKAVRQHLAKVLAEAAPVHVSEHARKLHARARKRVEKEGVELQDALRAEGATASTALALAAGSQRVAENEADTRADDGDSRRDELGLQSRALAVLAQLPERQRLAVATPLGLEGGRRSDAQLARHLGCTLAELLAAREAGLRALREALST